MWLAKYRLPGGRQVQRTIGKVWTERGRPPEGHLTKRTAEAWLRDVLDQAERGTLPGMVRPGRTFAISADEYLRYLTDDRQRKASTVRDARSVIANHLLPPIRWRALRSRGWLRRAQSMSAAPRRFMRSCAPRPPSRTRGSSRHVGWPSVAFDAGLRPD